MLKRIEVFVACGATRTARRRYGEHLVKAGTDRVITGKQRKSLTEHAYGVIREQIIVGALPPGTDISEPELAEQLQMSRTPVREALSRLCVEGFMEAFPRRGYRITAITVKDVNDLFAVRGSLEGTAAALAAKHLTSLELDELEKMTATSYVLGEDVSTKTFITANEDFHAKIARCSRNPRLYNLVMSHLEACSRLFYMGTRVRDINPETSRDHSAIVEALRERDSERAKAVMLAHNEHTRKGVLSVLIDEGQEGVTL